MSALDDVYVFQIDGHDYCQDCFIEQYFYGDRELLEDNLEDGDFTTPNGFSYGIIHSDTFQYQSYRGHIIPIEGIFCDTCGSECYPPDESTMCFHKIVCSSEKNRFKLAIDVKRSFGKQAVDSELFTTQDINDNTLYVFSFYTYEACEDGYIEELIQKYGIKEDVHTINKSIHTM